MLLTGVNRQFITLKIGLNFTFNLFFFHCLKIFAQTLLHKVKQQNEMGVVGKLYTVYVLTVYGIYLPKIINVALKLPKLL